MNAGNTEVTLIHPLIYLGAAFIGLFAVIGLGAAWENWRAKNSRKLNPAVDSGKE